MWSVDVRRVAGFHDGAQRVEILDGCVDICGGDAEVVPADECDGDAPVAAASSSAFGTSPRTMSRW